MHSKTRTYPFTGIVGQEDMKKALILNVINPLIGGVLIRGEKGTAKSTAVRSMAEIMPLRDQMANCRFSCNPKDEEFWCQECINDVAKEGIKIAKGKMRVINLPISATEDRVIGTLDIEHAIKHGEKKFEPGILAEANGNILYVDEVNLLEDHIVDLLLDAAAMGINLIEREGVSYFHPARFILVGTMNPEEGDLRPQLLDRFGLAVDVAGETDLERRVDVLERRLAFESNPNAFHQQYQQQQKQLGEQIEKAKKVLPMVTYNQKVIGLIAEIAIAMGVEGHRADITLLKTAITHAAYKWRKTVTKEDILVAAKLVLPHRMRKKPFQEKYMDFDIISKMIEEQEI